MNHTLALVFVLLLVLGVLSEEGHALQIARAYAVELAESDVVVVGTVLGTEEFDPYSFDRVSHISLSSVLYGDVGGADTIRVHWATSRKLVAGNPESWLSLGITRPDLEASTGIPYLWLLGCCRDSLLCAKDGSQALVPSAEAKLRRLVDNLRDNGGAASGYAQVRVAHAYLEGYVAGLSAESRDVGEEWRSN
jgi:hypothetical protein